MKEERLKELLGRYYGGSTSESEETELKNFFSGDSVPEGYDAEKAIFGLFSQNEALAEPSEGFSKRIINAIDDLEKNQKSNHARDRYIVIFSSAAAILLLILGSYFFFSGRSSIEDTFSDPQIAYAETMKILNEVSVKLNRGTKALKPLERIENLSAGLGSFDRSADIISKNLQRIKILNEMSDNKKQIK